MQRQQPELKELPSWQTMIIGLISGAMGPFSNAPIDTIKTRKSSPHIPSPSHSIEVTYSPTKKIATRSTKSKLPTWHVVVREDQEHRK